MLRNKYLRNKSLTQVKAKQTNSHFWRGLIKVKDEVLACGSFQIMDGTQIRFWVDTWASTRSFKEIFAFYL
jgi:hypothetical protein